MDSGRSSPAAGAWRWTSRRTEQDLPINVVVGGSVLLVVLIWLAPPLHVNLVSALLIVVAGFFFVTVSSRITGEIGSSSNPISGMTVATLLLTCLVYLVLGWTSPEDRFMALTTAAIVGIAASNGGTTAQDLKTAYWSERHRVGSRSPSSWESSPRRSSSARCWRR